MSLQGEGKAFEAIRASGDVDARWHELRRLGVGGSDVAAIMGISPWRSPYEVWLEKTGRSEPEDISGKEAVAMGVELEETVLGMYRRRHPEVRVRRVNAVLRSIDRPWAQASLDGAVVDPERGWGVLEIKTGSRESEWADGVPMHYLAQVTHYMSVTGWRYAVVAALIGDHGLHYHEHVVERDEEDCVAVTEVVDIFWNDFVAADVAPTLVTSLPSEGRALYGMSPEPDGGVAPISSTEFDGLAEQLEELNDELRGINKRKAECTNALKRMIGEHKGLSGTERMVTWLRTEKRDSGLRVRRFG